MFYFSCENSPKLGIFTKFSKQKDFREGGDIRNRKEKLLNRKIRRSDKKIFPALKYT